MGIRVTNAYIADQVVSDVNKNLKLLQEIQLKISTGLKINRPSDDPVGVIQTLKLRGSLANADQHQINSSDGRARLNATINALTNVEDLLLEIQGIATSYINTSYSISRVIIVNELNGLMDELLLNANAKYLGKYLFGGHESLEAPYNTTLDASGNVISVTRNRMVVAGEEVRGIDDPIYHTVDEGVDIQINVSGSLPFMPNGEGNTYDIFTTLINLRENIRSGDLNSVRNDLAELQDEFDRIVSITTVLGEKLNHLLSIKDNVEEYSTLKLENLSEILDVDYVKAITDLNYQQFILESSMQVGARIIPPSLLDFI